jgi:predicted metal-dependent hydrolase
LQFNLDLFEDPAADRIIIGADDQQSRIVELRSWLRHRARASFPGLLRQLSIRTGLGFNKVSIRSQKTRWGSCSARGNINLNDQLLFLPAVTVRYLMIHELCHTRHLNHSKAYWALVETHCPDYRQQDAVLSSSRDRVPDWLLLDLYN